MCLIVFLSLLSVFQGVLVTETRSPCLSGHSGHGRARRGVELGERSFAALQCGGAHTPRLLAPLAAECAAAAKGSSAFGALAALHQEAPAHLRRAVPGLERTVDRAGTMCGSLKSPYVTQSEHFAKRPQKTPYTLLNTP